MLSENNLNSLANVCSSGYLTMDMDNGHVVSPTVSSPHGTSFEVECDSGYNTMAPNGTLDCASNGNFTNRPSCDRKL